MRTRVTGPVKEVKIEYTAKLYEIELDYSKLNKIYNYNVKSSVYKTYTGDESDRLHPSHPWIKMMADTVWSNSEDYLDFARNAYRYLQKHFSYTLTGKTDTISDIIKNKGGECGALSSLYVSILRSGGIPARQLVGGLIKDTGEWGAHIWAEFYLEKYGWIPADPAYYSGTDGWFGYQSNGHIAFNIRRAGMVDLVATTKKTAGLQNFFWWMYGDFKKTGSLNYAYKVDSYIVDSSMIEESKKKSWAGTWDTPWGVLTLKERAGNISGSYPHKNGKIDGKSDEVGGKTILEGRWTEDNGTGWFVFFMSADGRKFSGKWGYDGNDEASGTWDGERNQH